VSEPRIIAAGGAMLVPEGNARLERYVLDATGEPRPRVCFVPTASGDDAGYVARFHETYGRFGVELGVLRFFRRTPGDLRGLPRELRRRARRRREHAQHARRVARAWVRGRPARGVARRNGALRLERGLDLLVRERSDRLDGRAARAHERPRLPHRQPLSALRREAERRPAYRAAVAAGRLAPGLACDDGAALDFVGEELSAVVSAKPVARAYRVDPGTTGTAVETPLESCILK